MTLADPPAPGNGGESTARLIRRLASDNAGRDVQVDAILSALQGQGFGVLMILFALPNAVIPGLSFILGAPVVLAGVQLALGRQTPWLPGFMRRRIIPAALFQRIAGRAEAFLLWVERRTRRRWTWLVSGQRRAMLGSYIAVIAVFLMLPVPFGNLLPALGISLMAVGLTEHDGKAAVGGALLGLAGAAYIGAAILLGIEALKAFIGLL